MAPEKPAPAPPAASAAPPTDLEPDFRIARDGAWYYRGTPIHRREMVRLFAGILRREADGCYYLVTKFQKCRIRVDDAPFIATALSVQGRGARQSLRFTLNTGEVVTAGPRRTLRLSVDADSGEHSPYLLVRDKLEALISRSVYYELAELGELRFGGGKTYLCLYSGGVLFRLGGVAPAGDN